MGSMSQMSPSSVSAIVDDIEKSPQDTRSYRGLLLANGLRAVVASDPQADKAAAAVCVRVGSLKDPRQWQGLAHFCEHMLFLGTEKYPDEDSYLRYIAEHGGARNAVTSAEFTRYFFDTAPEHLAGAVDRLSQFFVKPLFTESATQREVRAVHSEHLKNVPIDARRQLRLDHHLANQEHDYAKYSTGCLDTLLPDASMAAELRKQLLAFHAEHYSANQITVAVLGREPLDELQALVVGAFDRVANKDLPTNAWGAHPYEGSQCGVKVLLVPLRDCQKLDAMFPMRDYSQDYRCWPEHYTSHLLGHESTGSLLAHLKRHGWATGLSAGCTGGVPGYDTFRVSIDLTEAGLASQDAVLAALFRYVGELRRAGPQERIHRELSDLAALAFRFRDKDAPTAAVNALAVRLHRYPVRELLTAHALVPEFAPHKISQVLDQLRPDRCKIYIASSSHVDVCPEATDEPFYGVRYRVEPLSAELMAACQAGFAADGTRTPDLHLPRPNPFISTDFELRPSPLPQTACQAPQLLHIEQQDEKGTSQRRLRLWHRQDDEFHLPKLCITVALATPDASTDAFSAACCNLYCRLVTDALNSTLYEAELAGLAAAAAATSDGLTVSLHGYSEKLPALMAAVLAALARPGVEAMRFAGVLERYQKALKNFRLEQPLHQCYFNQSLLCKSVAWSHQQMLVAINGITLDRLTEFAQQLQSRLFADALVYGNADAAAAADVGRTLVRHLVDAPAAVGSPPERRPHQLRDVLLPASGNIGHHLLHRTLAPHHQSSACVVYFQTEPAGCDLASHLRQQVLVKLMVQALKERFFDSLRTKQQLGYMVQLLERPGVYVCGLTLGVQSDRHPVELEARIDEFVDAAGSYLAAMSAEQFRDHVLALNTRISERPKRLAQWNARYIAEIVGSGALCFDRAERQSELLLGGSIVQEDLLQFHKAWMHKDSPNRRKLSVHLISKNTFGSLVDDHYAGYTGTLVTDIAAFKSSSKLGPLSPMLSTA